MDLKESFSKMTGTHINDQQVNLHLTGTTHFVWTLRVARQRRRWYGPLG